MSVSSKIVINSANQLYTGYLQNLTDTDIQAVKQAQTSLAAAKVKMLPGGGISVTDRFIVASNEPASNNDGTIWLDSRPIKTVTKQFTNLSGSDESTLTLDNVVPSSVARITGRVYTRLATSKLEDSIQFSVNNGTFTACYADLSRINNSWSHTYKSDTLLSLTLPSAFASSRTNSFPIIKITFNNILTDTATVCTIESTENKAKTSGITITYIAYS